MKTIRLMLVALVLLAMWPCAAQLVSPDPGYIFQTVLVGVRFLLVAGARPGSHNIFPVAGTAAQIGNHTYVGVHIGALRQPHEAFVS